MTLHLRVLAVALSLTMVSAGPGAIAQQQQAPSVAPIVWIGIGFSLEKEIPSIEGTRSVLGLRVTDLPYGSPARRAGVLLNDLIVGMDGRDFDPARGDVEGQFREYVVRHLPGDEVTLRLIRDWVRKSAQVSGVDSANDELWRNPDLYLQTQPPGTFAQLTAIHERKVVDVKVVLEERPAAAASTREYSSNNATERKIPKITWAEEKLANALVDEFKIGEGYKDLQQRLAHLSDRGDLFRLSRVAYIQHEPFQLRTVADNTLNILASAIDQRSPLVTLHLAADWLDASVGATVSRRLKTGLTLEQHLEQLVNLFMQVRAKREEAFAKLTADERKYLEDNCGSVFTAFSEGVYLQDDRDQARWLRNARVLELTERVDFVKLFEAAELYWSVAQDEYLDDLESAVRKAWEMAGKPEGIFINRESPVGKIVVGGNGSTWYREDAAIQLDLGGKDFYTMNAGSPRGDKFPAALLIDFAGDDAYEATFNWTQGAAAMGYGILIDRKGEDQYIGREWAQGAAVLGAALFLDEAGDDVYRGDQYVQGVAAWGIAIHMDYEGNDVYEAHLLSQGVGMPGGAGWLLNGNGNDKYYSKGKYPTGYGDAGIFDSWSQGCGVGFRGLQSGGVALLYDGAGIDRYEAGNFSQGGGYYFGAGLLRDGGKENDVYIGSRYNQGFSAHQAVGYFEEMGGNDFYTTRQSVAQGLSWDETITVFIDHSGDDVYEGGEGFSQGASAYNGFCLFLDLGGRNRFVYGMPQASAGPNDAHGGTSFSMFVAADAKGSAYTSKMGPSSIRLNGEHGIFVDLPNSMENALKTKSWQSLIKKD